MTQLPTQNTIKITLSNGETYTADLPANGGHKGFVVGALSSNEFMQFVLDQGFGFSLRFQLDRKNYKRLEPAPGWVTQAGRGVCLNMEDGILFDFTWQTTFHSGRAAAARA